MPADTHQTTKWVDRGYTHPPDSSHYAGTSYFVEESNMSEAPPDPRTNDDAALGVIRAAIAYRRAKEAAGQRYPVRPDVWGDLVCALDRLALLGGEAALPGAGRHE